MGTICRTSHNNALTRRHGAARSPWEGRALGCKDMQYFSLT
jgi:hypothetical protein